MKYLTNSFSLGMLPEGASPVVTSLTLNDVRDMIVDYGEESRRDYNPQLRAKSIIGHDDIAGIVNIMLGISVPANRETVSLRCGDVLFVAQYVGPRLPEGCTTLPEGASIKWLQVVIEPNVAKRLDNLSRLKMAFTNEDGWEVPPVGEIMPKEMFDIAEEIFGDVFFE